MSPQAARRIGRLVLCLDGFGTSCEFLFSMDMPLLTSSVIQLPNPTGFQGRLSRQVLFGKLKTGLKALALSFISSWILINAFADLTHLYLSFDRYMHGCDIWVSDVITILSNTPNLTVFHLAGLPAETRPVERGGPPPTLIVFHHLRTLTFLKCDASSALRVLANLELDRVTLLRLDGLYKFYMGAFIPMLPMGGPGDFTELNIFAYNIRVHVSLDGPSRGFIFQGFMPEPVDEPRDDSMWGTWISNLHHLIILPFGDITRFNVDLPEYALAKLPLFLAHLPHLTNLLVGFELPEAPGHFSILCAALAQAIPTVCPSLRLFGLSTSPVVDGREYDVSPYIGAVSRLATSGSRMKYPIHTAVLSLVGYDAQATSSLWCRDRDLGRSLEGIRTHVTELQIVGTAFTDIRLSSKWRSDGAEDYWCLDPQDRPRVALPWE